MSWFGLFDHLRLRTTLQAQSVRDVGSALEGWALPGSQLRVTDRGLAALYRGSILAAGKDYRADMFDLAGHYLAQSRPAAAGQFHLDCRLTGRAQQILFGDDPHHGVIAWHLPSHTSTVRLPLGSTPAGVALPHSSLASLLIQTLPIHAIAGLTAWVERADQAIDLLRSLAPWLTCETQAILRVAPDIAPDILAALPGLPAQCVLILPCTGAADHDGRGEDPTELLICLELPSAQTPEEAAARAAGAQRPLMRETWNDKDRAWRIARQGGVAVQMPLPERTLRPGWTLGIVEDVPPTPIGVAVAALQTAPYRATAGFDYVADISGATLLEASGTVFVLPQDGPVLIEPALLTQADGEHPAPEAPALVASILAANGLLSQGHFAVALARPIREISGRAAFLLGRTDSAQAMLTELWPRMEYLFQQCEKDRLALDDFDILVPGGATGLIRDGLAMLGIDPARIREATEGVLFRRVLVVPPASRPDRAQRSAAFDQFWTRLDTLHRSADFTSFSHSRPAERLYLTTQEGPRLLNAPALEAIARQRGYQVIDTGRTDLTTLAPLLGAARVLIGTGAALAWSVLARNCAVGALLPDASADAPHSLLHAAAARDHTVSVAFGSSVGAFGKHGFGASDKHGFGASDKHGFGASDKHGFAVAPDLLDALIDRLERGTPAAAQTGAAR